MSKYKDRGRLMVWGACWDAVKKYQVRKPITVRTVPDQDHLDVWLKDHRSILLAGLSPREIRRASGLNY